MQYTNSGVLLSGTSLAMAPICCSGTFTAPGMWPPAYSPGVRTSTNRAPGVARNSSTPALISAGFRKSISPIAASSL